MSKSLHVAGSHAKELQFNITGSKSESNRLLILQGLYPQITIKNLSNSDDSKVLQAALASQEPVVDIHHAGTSMRFLTSYFAAKAGRQVQLTGSQRMQQRPIAVLVDALKQLDAHIEYQKETGFPPLHITGRSLSKNQVRISAQVSSQYISSLLLIGATLPKGLVLNLEGKITSVPYIKMTLSLLHALGIKTGFNGQTITVDPLREIKPTTFTVESDWSSASYFYSAMALGNYTSIQLGSYKKSSLQGDSGVANIFESLGVTTQYNEHNHTITLTKNSKELPKILQLDLSNMPDLAQTIACCCFGLKVSCELTGLHTLKIKETDRLVALKTELEKLGATIHITNESLRLETREHFYQNQSIATYQDHRMAMAFAPLAWVGTLHIQEPEVVSKSYPAFWEDMAGLGITDLG